MKGQVIRIMYCMTHIERLRCLGVDDVDYVVDEGELLQGEDIRQSPSCLLTFGLCSSHM